MNKKIYSFLLLLFCTANVFSQQYFDSLLSRLDSKYPQESVYMQLDKYFYSSGETIWFKAYIKDGNFPTRISTSFYAELITADGAILQRKTMPVIQAGAASYFELPENVPSSKLYIRGYTSWMLNFDSSSFYLKPVDILKKEASPRSAVPNKYTFTLFPEGGDLATGIESLVAFKTNDQDGNPFDVKGTVLNPAGKTMATFSSTHKGMGYFPLSPLENETYKAVWKDPAGNTQETVLPPARTASATLSVTNKNGVLKYTINRSPAAPEAMQEFFVIAQMHQQTVYAARINLRARTSVTAPIPTDSLYSGIMQITLFNKENKPVAERVSFINNNDYSFITDLHINEKNMTAKGRNVVQVDVGGQLKSNLSISVTDADMDLKPVTGNNIYSQILLSADLKGMIYDPAYYFSKDEDSVKQQLELVMMTNGWRRFNWEKILAGKWPEIKYSPENYLSIKGNAFGLTPMQLNDKILTGFIQTTKQADKSLVTIPVNKDGSFKLDDLYFFDTIKIFYQFNNDKDKRLTNTASFSFKNNLVNSPAVRKNDISFLHYSPQPPANIILKSIESNELMKEINKQKVKVLETVVVKGRVKSIQEKTDEEYSSGLFSSGNSRIFVTEGDPFANTAQSVLDYLRSKVPGLQINTSMGGGSITRRGSNTDVFLNEMNTTIDMIQSTPMSDVAMIKVFDPPFIGAFGGGAGGAVAVYTKKGGSSNSNVQGLNTAILNGYSSLKEFYIPDYDNKTIPLEADLRTTLYWNPFLLMNGQNKRIIIPFFNNDKAKRLRVVIEGINEKGELTREEKIFE